MDGLMGEIERRLTNLLEAIAAGEDLPPGYRHRLEGLCEAAVLTGVATEADVLSLLRTRYRACLGRELDDDLWEGWELLHVFPTLPLYMQRAPVSVSTSD